MPIYLQRARPNAGRRRSSSKKGEMDPSAKVTFKQGRTIGMSIGNMAAYCPSVSKYKTHADALSAMGLDRGTASMVIDALIQAGVVRFHRGMEWTPENGAIATSILEDVGGVSCALGNPYGALLRVKKSRFR